MVPLRAWMTNFKGLARKKQKLPFRRRKATRVVASFTEAELSFKPTNNDYVFLLGGRESTYAGG